METNRYFEEQKTVMKFLVKAGKTNSKIIEIMTFVYRDFLMKMSYDDL